MIMTLVFLFVMWVIK